MTKEIYIVIKRYKEYYDLDPYNKSNFDLIIDTSNLEPIQIVEKILDYINSEKNIN